MTLSKRFNVYSIFNLNVPGDTQNSNFPMTKRSLFALIDLSFEVYRSVEISKPFVGNVHNTV